MDTPQTPAPPEQRPQARKPPSGFVGEDTLMWNDISPEDHARDALVSMQLVQQKHGFTPEQAQMLYGGAAPGHPPGQGPSGPPPGFVPVGPASPQGGLPPGFEPMDKAAPTLGSDIAGQFHAGVEHMREAAGGVAGRAAETRAMGPMERARASQDHLREFLALAGGAFQAVTSPVTGAIGHLVAGTKPEETRLFQEMSPFERARASQNRPFEARGTREEQVERAGQALTLPLPFVGVGSAGALARGAGQSVAAVRQSPVFRTVEEIFSPTTIDANSRTAEALLRTATGTAARSTEQTRAAMEPFHRTINALPDADRLRFIDHVEGGTGGLAGLPVELRALGQSMRDAFELRAAKLMSLPSTATTHFIEDYFPHFWQDPKKATRFANEFQGTVGSRIGSGASLKARSVPTIADGIKAGLVPVTTDPIEATIRYIASMDRFTAHTSVLDFSKQTGYIKWIKPKVYGASGHPDSFKVPEGWSPLNGRGTVNANGAHAYAPDGFARVFNNFVDRGIYEWGPTSGSVYENFQKASNAVTALELGLSGYHAVTMANEAAISRLARGVSDIVGGAARRDAMRMLRGGKAMVSAPLAPVTSALKGRQLERVYLGRSAGSPDMYRIVDLLEKAGGRATGSRHAADYQFSNAGSFVRALRQGALKLQMQTAAADIRAHPVIGTVRQTVSVLGRVMSTVADPIFNLYIPKLKNGAFYETMESWLQANPTATRAAQVQAARDIWDSIDNRFGELVDDNIFWNKTLKQAAQLGMRSYSWNLGTAREIGGGVADLASGQWSPRAAYVVALPFWVGTMNAIYQYIKTGKNPESIQDLVGGQTGGEQSLSVPSTQPFHRSGKSTVSERVQIPGYQKDVMGWYENWQQEASNKIAKLPAMVIELGRNQDWKGDPILNPESTAPEWLKQFFGYVAQSLTPISLQGIVKGQKEGTAITRPEQLMGLRPAPPYVADPEGYERQQHNLNVNRQRKKERGERKQERLYGGGD